MDMCCCSVAKACLTLWPHGLQHTRLPCLSPSPIACSNSFPLNRRCHLTSSSSAISFSSHFQSFPTTGSFPVRQLFAWSDQSNGASASALVLLMDIQDWFHLGLTGLISLLSKPPSRVFSSTTVQKNVSLCCKLCKGLFYHTLQSVRSKCRIELMRIGILSCSVL